MDFRFLSFLSFFFFLIFLGFEGGGSSTAMSQSGVSDLSSGKARESGKESLKSRGLSGNRVGEISLYSKSRFGISFIKF